MGTSHEPTLPGVETDGLEMGALSTSGPDVEMVTVDALVAREKLEVLDYLSIDTEGWDVLVLEGARDALTRKRVRVLQFEYHEWGPWGSHKLGDSLAWLGQLGYDCFWQGNSGELAPATTSCDNEFHKWSNVVCSAEASIVRALRTLSIEVAADQFASRHPKRFEPAPATHGKNGSHAHAHARAHAASNSGGHARANGHGVTR